ncbi:hypothetical protein [Mucilaginibacter boryungensis]|uniref:Lipocalin-like protein n=1 Tax=Mucilaginibacter boryungensis TaxID=768480 RepID=A0ABR9XJW2_9SPHI|nr:hypothetical protein [Mucilaginibacter boryungensis]MBE9667324.1 hypothetical protein [Mucilaginibacter boryungensis]
MKSIWLSLLIICCFSCSNPVNKHSSNDTVSVSKFDGKEKVDGGKDSSNDIRVSTLHNKMIGIWTAGESENATFDMRKDSVYYVDQFSTYKYTLKKDSITFFYSDGPQKFKIYFVRDTMVMENKDFGTSKFWKFKG